MKKHKIDGIRPFAFERRQKRRLSIKWIIWVLSQRHEDCYVPANAAALTYVFYDEIKKGNYTLERHP